MSHLSGWFITILFRQAFMNTQHILSVLSHRHTIQNWPCALRHCTHSPCSRQRTIYSYDTDTSDREHARLYQHIRTLYCGPDVLYMCPSHSPQDLSKSEKETEPGTHRNKPTIINHRPDDSHVSDTKIF